MQTETRSETIDAILEIEEALDAQGADIVDVVYDRRAPTRTTWGPAKIRETLRGVLIEWRTPSDGIELSGVVYDATHYRIGDKSLCGIDGVPAAWPSAMEAGLPPSCAACRDALGEEAPTPGQAESFVGMEIDGNVNMDDMVEWARRAADAAIANRRLRELLDG